MDRPALWICTSIPSGSALSTCWIPIRRAQSTLVRSLAGGRRIALAGNSAGELHHGPRPVGSFPDPHPHRRTVMLGIQHHGAVRILGVAHQTPVSTTEGGPVKT